MQYAFQYKVFNTQTFKPYEDGYAVLVKYDTLAGNATTVQIPNDSPINGELLGCLDNIHNVTTVQQIFKIYIISMPNSNLPTFDTIMPIIRDHDAKKGYVYYRGWSGGILSGSFERRAKIAFDFNEYHNIPPHNFSFGLFDDDWDHFLHRCPVLQNAQNKMINGPESFAIDVKCLFGEVPELFNYIVACGIGKLLSKWIIYNHPTHYDNEYEYKNNLLYEIEKEMFSCWSTQIDIINIQNNGAKAVVVSI